MLSYRHAFHAGNHADVFKHLVLTLLLQTLSNKEKPFFYLDTHSGAGQYPLDSGFALKNRESASGIERLWSLKEFPEMVRDYLAVVRSINPSGRLRRYPGSPRIARSFLRLRDRLALCELHPNEAQALTEEFQGDQQVTVHHGDCYQGLNALLPPRERRGLVLIDPAFELKDERRRLVEALQLAYQRWSTGIFAIWYPIQDRVTPEDLLRRIEKLGLRKILLVEFRILGYDEPLRLNGSGMLIVNPPWKLDEQLHQLLPWLWETLAVEGQGGWRVEWLVPE